MKGWGRRREAGTIRLLKAFFRRLPRGQTRLAKAAGVTRMHKQRLLSLGDDLLIPVSLSEFGPRSDVLYGPSRQWGLSWHLIRSGDVVLDVGANIGMWGLRAAQRVGPTGSVHCFEPNRDNAERLMAHAAMNSLGNLRVHQVALGERDGTTPFYVPERENSGRGRLAPGEGLHSGLDVEIAPLDAIRSEYQIERVDLMKVDVEGSEELVFAGAQRTLAADDGPIILFESAPEEAAEMGSSCETVWGILEGHGYRVYRLAGEALSPVSGMEAEWEDLFALKRGHFESNPLLSDLLRAGGAPLPPARREGPARAG